MIAIVSVSEGASVAGISIQELCYLTPRSSGTAAVKQLVEDRAAPLDPTFFSRLPLEGYRLASLHVRPGESSSRFLAA
jgi:hypothetical protein